MGKSIKYKLPELAQYVREEVEAYLKSTEKTINTDPYNPDLKFPERCCKGASHILGLIMNENLEMKNVKYVWGTSQELGTHGWIEYDSILLDITIDQFDFSNKTLVVEKGKSDFHTKFKNQEKFEIDVREGHNFRNIYNDIINKTNINSFII